MTKQTKRPGMGMYLAVMFLLLMAYQAISNTNSGSAVTYAKVEQLFYEEQVVTFSVRNGNELYLALKDGSTVYNELGSVEKFREDMEPLIRQQKESGILKDYDFKPTYTPPWWSEVLLYGLLIGGVFLFWQFMMMKGQGGMDQGKKFGRAKIRFGSDSKEKVSFTDVAGADEEKAELQEIVASEDEESLESYVARKKLEGKSNNWILVNVCIKNPDGQKEAFMRAIDVLRTKHGANMSPKYWYFFRREILSKVKARKQDKDKWKAIKNGMNYWGLSNKGILINMFQIKKNYS